MKILKDEDASNPRHDYDHLGTFYMKHGKYDFGDKDDDFGDKGAEPPPEDFDGVVLPVYMYDHSGLTINTTGFSCPWDSGQIGVIYVSRKRIKQYGWENLTTEQREKIERILRSEIEELDFWLRGEVYGYVLIDEIDEEIDSCWGFYGDDPRKNGMGEHVDLSEVEIERAQEGA